MKYMPTVLLVLSALGSVFAPQIQHMVSAHPSIFGVVASLLGVVLHWLPAPTTPAA